MGGDTPYGKLKDSLDRKYQKDYDFGKREQELFLNGDGNFLITSYETGQVIFSIKRLQNGKMVYELLYNVDWFGKMYHDKFQPKNANVSDF